ncbi:MAG: redox-regulated ATPase YchF [Anaerolineae bacterium]|nr:redox-regulated ATPase YchF [Anaerolineae bacterium]
MKLGIIGLPGAGKTTIFNALTRGDAPTGRSMGGRFDVLTAVVEVPDWRVGKLAELFSPRKLTYAQVVYADIAGLQKGMGENGGLAGPLLNHLAGLDALVHVVRAFEDDLVPHPDGSVGPLRDLTALDTELLLNDLVVVEGKLERLAEGLRKGSLKNRAEALAEQALFARLHAALNEETPLRDLGLDPADEKALRGYGLLTLKPVLVVFNIGDDQDEVRAAYAHAHTAVVNLRGRLEAELAQLAPDEVTLFMDEYGVAELGLDRVIRESYDLLGLHSFFTVGEDEVRAWTVRREATAVEAAGTIHTDLARGFIRAEVVRYDELLQLGGMAGARAAGRLRLEGKQYQVQDGEIMHVKFNV